MAYQGDPMKVLTGEVRLSFVHVTAPRVSAQGGEPRYSATLLIPKTDVATKADIDASIQAAAQAATPKLWNGARPPQLRTPIYDGDGARPSGEPFSPECKSCWVMTASSKMPPQVVHGNNIYALLAPMDIYSGMYARVTIRFFGYSNSGNKGIGCGLGNIMKTRDGEMLSGRTLASSDFADFGNPALPPQANAGAPFALEAPAYPQPLRQAAAAINPFTGTPLFFNK